MKAVTICTFHDHKIDVLIGCLEIKRRIFNDRLVESADVAGVTNGVPPAVISDLDHG